MRACLAVASKAEADTWKNSNKTLLCSQADWQNSATPFSRLNNSGIFIHFLSSFLLQRLRGFCQLNILSNVIRQTMRYEPICLSTRKSCRKSLIGTSIVSKMDTKLISPMEPWTTLQTTSKPNLTSMQYRYSVLCLGLILFGSRSTNKRELEVSYRELGTLKKTDRCRLLLFVAGFLTALIKSLARLRAHKKPIKTKSQEVQTGHLSYCKK